MKRDLGDGYELDDEPGADRSPSVHGYLSLVLGGRAVARGPGRIIDGSAGVVSLYHGGEQIGFSRTLSDRQVQSYLADVYVLEEHRGRGLGVELVRFSVDEGRLAGTKWYLHTRDARDLYAGSGLRSRVIACSSGTRVAPEV